MLYFKRFWKDSSGENSTNHWGSSTFYFETDHDFYVNRQIQQFENNKVLKYDLNYLEDKYGGLSEVPLDIEEFQLIEISSSEFNQIWSNSNYKKFPEIVITKDILWGQPRLDSRRLAVGDIVSHIAINDNFHDAIKDYNITVLEAKQAILYCKLKQCIQDNPIKFCHNCTLRVEQDNEEIDEEKDFWVIANQIWDKEFK